MQAITQIQGYEFIQINNLCVCVLEFYVTCNNISVIYVTAQKCSWSEKLYLRSGSERHRHFVEFLNVPFKHRHGVTLFIRLFRETAPCSRLLRHAGESLDVFSSKPPPASPPGHKQSNSIYIYILQKEKMCEFIVILQKEEMCNSLV